MKGANEFLIVSGKHLFRVFIFVFQPRWVVLYLLGWQFQYASHFAV